MTDYYLVMYKREIKSFVAFHMLNFNNKKQNSKALFLIFVTIFVIIINGCASQKEQISKFNWVKYSGNPIIYEGKKGEWNQMMGDPFVMRDESMYKMWFGANMPIDEKKSLTQVGYAESKDGIKWGIHPEPVLRVGARETYDATVVETPTVVKDETGYHMWYSSVNKFGGDGDEGIYRIGHATSNNGINWTKDKNNPVIKAGDLTKGEWNSWASVDPTVIKEDGIFKMWFIGITYNPPNYETMSYGIGYATSADGSNWELYSNNPVLEVYNGPYENKVINSAFFVLNNEKYYELWYFGGNALDIYATSSDGIKWQKHEGTFLPKGPAGSWDSWVVSSPTVLLNGSKYKMWYSGAKIDENYTMHFGIGYATNNIANELIN